MAKDHYECNLQLDALRKRVAELEAENSRLRVKLYNANALLNNLRDRLRGMAHLFSMREHEFVDGKVLRAQKPTAELNNNSSFFENYPHLVPEQFKRKEG